MNHIYTCLLLWSMCLSIATATAQSSTSATEVLPNGDVVFRIHAPNASEVKLMSYDKWDKVDFIKNEDGTWEGKWLQVKPGIYSYKFIIDGVSVLDPNAVEVNESTPLIQITDGTDFFAQRKDNVHGALTQRYYYSETLHEMRRLHVWTPAGFEKSRQKLPVLYLIHGGGGTDKSWSTTGAIVNIMDNLMAEGKIEPMIVVMPNGTIETDPMLGRLPLFEQDMITSIIPFIEDNYPVKTKASNRAIMGLSMGGLETLEVITKNPETFQYIGILSSGWWISESWQKERGEIDDKTRRLNDLSNIADTFNSSVKLLHFTQGGSEDLAYDNGMQTLQLFDKANIKYTCSQSPGGHTWMVWRKNLWDIAPLLFK